MSISTTARKAGPYAGDGTTTVFPFAFKVFATTDVAVYATDAFGIQTLLTVGYTVQLNSNQDTAPGGTVTFLLPPALLTTVTLGSQVTATQPMVLTNNGGFFPKVLNDAADREVILIQQLAEQQGRTLTAPISSSEPAGGLVLPTAVARAGKVLGFAADGSIVPLDPSAGGADLTLRAELAAATGAGDLGTLNGPLQDVIYGLAAKQPAKTFLPLKAGLRHALADIARNFYDPVGDTASGNLPRIRPTDGNMSLTTAGLPNKDMPRDGSWWQMALYLIAIYNQWKINGDEPARLKLVAQAAYLKANYTIAELGGDGTNFSDGKTTINSLDDGGWVCLSLGMLHEATQDFFWLRALRSAIPAILRRFVDPNSTPIVLGTVYDEQSATTKNFQYSPYGCQYDTGTDAGNNTASFEQILAIAALYVYKVDSNNFYLQYAQAYGEIENTYFAHSSGNHVLSIGLNPAVASTYLKDTKATFGYPQEGITNLGLGSTLWAAILYARLYNITNTTSYLTRIQAIASGIVKPQGPSSDPTTWGFVSTTTTTTGVFLAMTDPFSDGVPFAQFADECLTLAGVDGAGTFKTILKATGLSIIAGRAQLPYPPTPTTLVPGAYGADWGGALLTPSPAGLIAGYSSYQAHFAAAVGPEAGGQQIMPNACALSVLQAATLVEGWGVAGIPTPVSAGYDASQALVADQFARTRPLIQIVSDNGYDVTSDIQAARAKPGWTGDVAAIETACNTKSRRVVIRPDAGGITWDRRMKLLQGNQQLACLGGMQAVPFVMSTALADGAISVGRPSDGGAPAGGFIADNLWFVQPGRLGYGSGALANMLTGGQAFLEICQGQAFKVRGCGGYGMPHAIKVVASSGIIENGFHYGGVYNPLNAAAQEAISQIYLADGTPYGLAHNTNITIRDLEGYGGNTLGVQSRTIGGKTVQAIQHCGPRFGVLAESVECLTMDGGFLAGYAEAAFAVKPSSASCILLRIVLNGTFLDESNSALLKTFRESDSYPALDTLILNGCDMNGQIIAENGLRLQLSPGNLPSVIRVIRNASPIRAVLGSAARLDGYDQYDETASNAYGYNLANNDDTAGAGLYTSGVYTGAQGGVASIMTSQFGGGQNGLDSETNTVDPTSGLTPNGCKWGLYSANSKTSQAFTRTRNLAKAGGGRLGGTVTTLTA